MHSRHVATSLRVWLIQPVKSNAASAEQAAIPTLNRDRRVCHRISIPVRLVQDGMYLFMRPVLRRDKDNNVVVADIIPCVHSPSSRRSFVVRLV